MRSAAYGLVVVLLAVAIPAVGEESTASTAPTVGLIAASTEEITLSLAAGARLALAEWGRRTGTQLGLVVSDRPQAWSAASGPAVAMAFEHSVVALVTPPERDTAHLLAQLASRAHLPVVSTAEASTVTAAGSYWVISVVSDGVAGTAFSRAFREVEGRDPDRWAVLGYDAAAAVAAAVDRVGLDRRAVVEAWRDEFSVEGAAGSFSLARSGRRRR
jgi:ABC-type branched-subunit amino acid transport system substrate-binding protein